MFFFIKYKKNVYSHYKLTGIENSLYLRNLSKIRCIARAELIKVVWISYEIILEAIQIIPSGLKLDKNIRRRAFELFEKMLSFNFVIALYFMNKIMYEMKILTGKLELIVLNVIDTLILLNNTIEIFQILNNINNNDE